VVTNGAGAISAGNSGPVCAGSGLQLTASSLAGANYSWVGPNGFSSSVQNPFIPLVSSGGNGVYSVTATVGSCAASAVTTVVVNSLPVVSASANSPLCAGQTLTVSASSLAGASYSWTGPNGFSASGQTASVVTAGTVASGVYSVVASVNGCSGPAGVVTVLVKPVPSTPVVSNNGPLCVGQIAALMTESVSGASYSWTGPNGFVSNVQNPVLNNVSISQSGVYSLVVSVNGCSSGAAGTALVINGGPSVSANNSGPICAGSSLSLSATTIAGAVYNWSGPNGFSTTTQNPVLSNASTLSSGVYAVTASVNGCTSSVASTTVIVKAVPATPVISGNSPLCAGQSLNLQTPTVSGGSYQWSGPNGFSSTAQNPVLSNITTAAAGVYQLIVTVNGCSSSASTYTVMVNAVPLTPTIGSNSPLCVGQSLQLTGPTVAGATYMWAGPNGFSANTQNANVSNAGLNASGVYSLVLSVNGCSSGLAQTTVVVNEVPVVGSIGSNSPVCAGQTLSLSAPLIVGATYLWVGPNGFSASTQNVNISNANTQHTGAYILTVSKNGCISVPQTINAVVNMVPVAPTAGSNSALCVGQSLALTSSTVAGASYVWTGPNGFSANTQNASLSSVSASAAGVYSVAAMVNGCMSGPGVTTVVVHALPTASLSGTHTVCAGESTNISIGFSGKGPWTVFYTGPNGTNSVVFGDANSFSPSTFNWSVSPVNSATYTLVSVTDGNGCSQAGVGSATVNVVAKPSAQILGAPTATVCAGSTVNIPMQVSGIGPWTLNYTSNGIGQPAIVVGGTGSPSPSVFNVPVVINTNSTLVFTTVMSGNGCMGVVNSTFVANVSPASTAVWSQSNLNVCAGSSVNVPLSLTGVGPWTVNYTANGINESWTLGNSGSPSPSVFAPSVSPTQTTTYSLVSVVSGNGCVSNVSGSMVVSVKSVPTATLSSGNSTICMNEGVSLNITLSGTGPWVVNYTVNGQPQAAWTLTSSPATVTVSPTGNSVYALTSVSDASGCSGVATGSQSIIVNPSASVSLTGGGSICTGGSSLATVVANGKGPWTISYTANGITQPSWVVGNANSASPSVFVLTLSPTETTVYAGLSVVDGNGCTGVANGSFTVAVNGVASGSFGSPTASICSGGTASVSLSLSGSGPWTVNYTANGIAQTPWILGDAGSASPSLFMLNLSPTVATTYTLTSISSSNGCVGAGGSSVAVSIVAVPTATLANTNSSVCAGGSSTLALTLTGQGPWTVNYSRNGNAPQTWSLGTSNSVSPSTFFVTVTPTESSTYTLTAVSSGACAGSVTGSAVVTVKPLPTAVFVNSTATVCGNGASPVFLPVSLTGTGPWTLSYTAGGVVQPPVTVGNSSSPSPSTFNLTVVPTANTVYVLTNVSAGNGCSQAVNSTTVVTVRPLPTAVFSTTNQTICQGSSINLPVTLSGTGPWSIVVSVSGNPQTFVLGNANSPSPSTFMIAVSPSITSLVTILNVTDGGGCTRTSGSRVTVLVSPAPTAVLSGGGTICAGQSTNLSVVFTGKGPWTLEHTQNGIAQAAITLGTATSPSPSTFSLAMNPTQTTTYTLTGVSSGTCVGTASGSAVVNVTNGPTLAIQNQSPAQCGQGGSVSLSGGQTYTLNGVTNTTGSFTNLQPGVYTVTATDAGGCVGSLVVTISGGASLPTITSITNVTASTAIVNWTTVPGAQTYTVAYRPIGASSFSFLTGITGLTATLTGLTGGTTYEVKVKAICPEGIETAYSPIENFTTITPPACPTPENLTVTVTGTTSAILNWLPNQTGAVCYIISYGPINANETTWTTLLLPHPATTVTINNLTPGISYGARIRTNCSLCSSRSGIRSDVSAVVNFSTPTAKGAQQLTTQTTDAQSIRLYPNPNRGNFSVALQATQAGSVSYQLTDATGRTIVTKTIATQQGLNETHFDLSQQAAGVYLLYCNDGTRTQTLKVVVR